MGQFLTGKWLTFRAARAFSDIPELDEDFWKRAELAEPDRTEQITLRVKRSVLAYFRASGKGYQTRINQVLESYVRAHSGVAPR